MHVNRIVKLLAGSMLGATLAFASLPAIAAAASPGAIAGASLGAPAASSGTLDPHPGPPWVFSGHAFTSESACEATGRAYVNSGLYTAWTCRYEGGVYRLYLIPAPCFSADLVSLPSRLVARCS